MTIQYVLEVENFNKMVEERKLEGVYSVDADKYDYIEIGVDFDTDNVSVWGCAGGSAEFLGDYVTVDLDELERNCDTKRLDDLYADNVEIAHYLECFDIPYEWALGAVDEWRSPEEEEEELNESQLWDAIANMIVAYQIYREEN